jgi:hypothetical protein
MQDIKIQLSVQEPELFEESTIEISIDHENQESHLKKLLDQDFQTDELGKTENATETEQLKATLAQDVKMPTIEVHTEVEKQNEGNVKYNYPFEKLRITEEINVKIEKKDENMEVFEGLSSLSSKLLCEVHKTSMHENEHIEQGLFSKQEEAIPVEMKEKDTLKEVFADDTKKETLLTQQFKNHSKEQSNRKNYEPYPMYEKHWDNLTVGTKEEKVRLLFPETEAAEDSNFAEQMIIQNLAQITSKLGKTEQQISSQEALHKGQYL